MPDIFVAKETVLTTTGENKILEKIPFRKKKVNLFRSFIQDPEGLLFEDQEIDEKIHIFTRKHFYSNLDWISTAFVFFLVPIVLLIINQYFLFFPLNLPFKFIIIFTIFYYFLLTTYCFVNFITWYYNISLVTNKRIIQVDFSGLVYKNVATTKIDFIQDASYTQDGVIPSFFDYGNVLLQTAGNLENFFLHSVPKPEKIVQAVERLIGKK